MWGKEFSEQLLAENHRIVILCQTEELERECAKLLDELGYRYHDNIMVSERKPWKDYGENFCYYINSMDVKRGSVSGTDSNPYSRWARCTFTGTNAPDFEVASDGELRDLLGIGGG